MIYNNFKFEDEITRFITHFDKKAKPKLTEQLDVDQQIGLQ
jgi:hypothetical protein